MADRIVVMDAGPDRADRLARRRSTTIRTRPSSRASWAPRTRIDLDVRASRRRRRGEGRRKGTPPPGTAPCRSGRSRLISATMSRRSTIRTPGSTASIVLPGRITQRTYPGGHYRYVVAIGDRHFTVTDDRYHELDRAGRPAPSAGFAAPVPHATQIKGGTHA